MEQFQSLEALLAESVAGAGKFEVLAKGHGMRSALSVRLALLYYRVVRALGFVGAAGMVLISLFFGQNAQAQDATAPATHDRTSSLSWIRMPGAESCIPTQELARAVEARLARTVFVSASQGDVSIEGRIDRKGAANHWHATIILRDSKGATIGSRDLDRVDAACSGMNEQLALVIAVMIDPDAALSHPAPPAPSTTAALNQNPPPAPTPAATTPPTPPHEKQNPPASIETKSPPKQADPWFFEASAAALGEIGMTPNPEFGLGVSSLLEAPHVPIAIDGSAAIFFDSTADAPSGASTSFTLGLLGGGLCPLRFRNDRVHVFGCLISQLGLLRSESQGYATTTGNKLSVLYNIGLEARASLRIAGPFALRAGISWVIPLIRSPYDYDRGTDRVQLFQVAPVALTGDLGIGFEFP